MIIERCTDRVNLAITPSMHDALAEMAIKYHTSISGFVKLCMIDVMDEEGMIGVQRGGSKRRTPKRKVGEDIRKAAA
jgi:hypothetical protein